MMHAPLDSYLQELQPRQQAGVGWFRNNAGTTSGWPKPLPCGQLLATKAKGIYKPKGLEYALSVRSVPSSKYPDGNPVHRADGTWYWKYYQEDLDPALRDKLFTNIAMMACLRDKVPIGAMIQSKPKPGCRYLILGVALVAKWESGYFLLEGFGPDGKLHDNVTVSQC